MGLPSSETATMPASRMAAMSAMFSPLLPMLAAPMGQTWTWPWALARSTMKRVMEALSLTGLVLGMQQTTVKPPRAAARVPVSMVSEFSWPGSRRCTCISMKPGATTRPVASKTSAPFAGEIFPGAAISEMVSPSSRMSRTTSILDAGSRTRPFLIRSMRGFLGFGFGTCFKSGMRAFRCADHEQIEDGHAGGDAIGDLLKHAGLRAVGDFGSNFGAAIDGAGMQDEGIGLGEFHALGVELVEQDVVALRERRFVEALGLHAENDDNVGVFESLLNAIDAADGRAGRADFFEFAGNPHGRAAESETAAEFSEEMDIGAGHAGVGDVTEDGDVEIVDVPFSIADGQRVEQALGRVLMGTVAGVDYRNFQMPGDEIGGAGGRVAHDEAIRAHGVEIVGGVEKGFALFQAGGFGLEIHGVRAETRGGGGEAEARARGVFKKGQGDGFAAKSRQFLEGMALNFLEGFGLIQKEGEFVRGERFESQEVAKTIGQIRTRLHARGSAPRLIR